MDSIRIRNLRSLADTETIELRTINLLVGTNNSGKSTFLRFFPLLRQSVEVPTGSGLLLVGRYVDFGSFKEAVRMGAIPSEITFDLTTTLKPIAPYYYDQVKLLEQLRATVAISFAKRSTDLKSYVSKLELQFGNDTVRIESSEDAKVSLFQINHFDSPCQPTVLQLKAGRGFIPTIAPYKTASEVGPTQVSSPNPPTAGPFSQRLLEATNQFFDRRTYSETKFEIIRSVGIGSPEAMHTSMQSVTDNAGWNKMLRRHGPSDVVFQELRNLILADRLRLLLLRLDDTITGFAKFIRSVAPVRASADRYIRNQELAIDEVEPDGRNLPMFLAGLTRADQEGFSKWTQKHLGFAVKPEGDVHLSLKLHESGTTYSFNLADTGFGFSQILPILAQVWLLANRSGKFEHSTAERRFRIRRGEELPSEYTVVIEQPELHLHPAMQARLFDILIDTAAVARQVGITVHFLLETHSETIVNRAGQKIGLRAIEQEQVQVLLFERAIAKDGFPLSSIRRTYFNQDGILENWPFGFFLPEEDVSNELELDLKPGSPVSTSVG